MKFSELYKYWQEDNATQGPGNLAKFAKSKKGDVKPHYLPPMKMQALINSFSPHDLYMNPDSSPRKFDYSTQAYNISNPHDDLGVKDAIVFSDSESRNLPLNQMDSFEYRDIPPSLRNKASQAVYAHEMGHVNDPRLNPMAKNYGYMKKNGMSGEIWGRELPAIRAEDRFWGKAINEKRMKLRDLAKKKKGGDT